MIIDAWAAIKLATTAATAQAVNTPAAVFSSVTISSYLKGNLMKM